jgi:hypothetical protein
VISVEGHSKEVTFWALDSLLLSHGSVRQAYEVTCTAQICMLRCKNCGRETGLRGCGQFLQAYIPEFPFYSAAAQTLV